MADDRLRVQCLQCGAHTMMYKFYVDGPGSVPENLAEWMDKHSHSTHGTWFLRNTALGVENFRVFSENAGDPDAWKTISLEE